MTLQTRNLITPFESGQLEAIAKVLADTNNGLTGTEIGRILEECKIEDPDPTITKWKRLFNAFVSFQNRNHAGNHVIIFINKAMSPAKHIKTPETFTEWRSGLNAILCLTGMEVGEDGVIRKAKRVSTLIDAIARANRLKAELERRGAHQAIFKYCQEEIVSQNYFHTVFEAMKSISSRIREISGLDGDGHNLFDKAFAMNSKNPMLAINQLQTETQRGEQKGFLNFLKGLYGTVRNPQSHEAKIEWEMSEEDALDVLTAISFVHRKLDKTAKAAA